MPILANATCQASVEFHPGYTLCTGGTGYRPATCHGDSGGPLVVETAAGPLQIGITSYGSAVGCGIAPDYFTRVSSVQTWIASAIAGAAAPPSFVPPFNPPAAPPRRSPPTASSATFAAPAADPATLPTAFAATLVAANGTPGRDPDARARRHDRGLPERAAGHLHRQPRRHLLRGRERRPAVSAPVTLAAPKAKTNPRLVGPNVVGYRIGCKNGSWAWPGGASFTVEWLRAGKVRKGQTATSYRIANADVGKKIACRVTLHATTGSRRVGDELGLDRRCAPQAREDSEDHRHASVGSTLQCTTGTWKHTARLTHTLVWRRDSKIIRGAKKPRRTLVAADRGHQITCKVSVKAGPQTAWYRTASVFVR